MGFVPFAVVCEIKIRFTTSATSSHFFLFGVSDEIIIFHDDTYSVFHFENSHIFNLERACARFFQVLDRIVEAELEETHLSGKKGAPRFELGTNRSAVGHSTAELYARC